MESDRDTIFFYNRIDEASEGAGRQIRRRIRLHAEDNNNRRLGGRKEQSIDKIHARPVSRELYDDDRDQSLLESPVSGQYENQTQYLGYRRTGKVQDNHQKLL